MAQKKLQRFAELADFPNVLQYPTGMHGAWKNFFKNSGMIVLELACGKGEYSVELAKLFPERNFIGIDLKGNRIWVGARKSLNEGLSNVAFLRTQIDMIDKYFVSGEVSEIWITFPDPQLRTSRAKKRLTHPRFLRLYQKILQPGGFIHLKTDSPALYNFTKTVIEMYGLVLHADQDDIHSHAAIDPVLLIKTYYESLDIANHKRVHYLKFSLPQHPLPEFDDDLKEIIREAESDRRS